nr:LLM class F420-dependent oxidoreductase [Nocardioides zeae]
MSNASMLLSNLNDADELLGLADVAVDCGFERVWLAETGGLDVDALGAVIARTTPLEVGTSIIPVYSRTPALLSMMASTISHLGGGRPVHLGIGAGGQVIVERWHGVPFSKPATVTRETIQVLRQALAGGRTDVDGKTRRSHGFQLTTGPAPEVRVYIGGMGPVMVDLAAEVADGLIVTWLSPRVLTGFRAQFSSAVAAHGRDERDVKLVARVYASVSDTPEVAREEVRKELVEYVVSPGYGRYFASVGFEKEVEEVNAAFEARQREAAVAAVSDALLDEVLVVGRDAAEVRDALRAYAEAGADDVMVQPVPTYRGGNPEATIRAVAEAMRN